MSRIIQELALQEGLGTVCSVVQGEQYGDVRQELETLTISTAKTKAKQYQDDNASSSSEDVTTKRRRSSCNVSTPPSQLEKRVKQRTLVKQMYYRKIVRE